MPSNYTGNDSTSQPPSPKPATGALPILSLPSSGDPLTAASVAQAFKTLADFGAFAADPARYTASDLIVREDFNGELSTSTYENFGSQNFALVNDTANGASGAVTCSLTTNDDAVLSWPSLCNLNAEDFVFSARVRIPSIGGGGSAANAAFVGFADSGFTVGAPSNVALLVYSPIGNGNSNWWLWWGGGNAPTAPVHKNDTHVSAASSAYQILTIVRASSNYTALINGTAVATQVDNTFLGQCTPLFLISRQGSGTTTGFCDYIKLWARTPR